MCQADYKWPCVFGFSWEKCVCVFVINIQCLSACLEVLAEVGEIDSSSLGDCGWKTTTCLLGPSALDS